MGFFSWTTSNTKRSISNIYSEKSTFPVLMIDDKGNVFREDGYEGYGVFGGKDYYELVAEMNNSKGLTGNENKDRSIGVDLVFKNNPSGSGIIATKNGIKVPVLVEESQVSHMLDNPKEIYDSSKPPEPCDYQGYFYEDDEYEDDSL